MFLGNVLTSVVGAVVAVMIGSGSAAIIGVPLAFGLCWLPARRLVRVAPLAWLRRMSPFGLAFLMTAALMASCVFFIAARGALESHQLRYYWTVKVIAIFLALAASVSLTTIWEEWTIWRLSSRPEGTNFFVSTLRANLYVLILILAIPAALILPKRLKSPDFLAKRPTVLVVQASPASH
jgi:hypothetical protein